MKKIAIIGHSRTMTSVTTSIRQHYKELETVEIEFIDTDMKESAVEYLKAQLPLIDGIVFTGRKPYEIINSAMGVTVPQAYIRHDRSILLQTMLEATAKQGYDLRSFSYDSYDEEELMDAFMGFGMDQKELELYTAPRNITGDNLVWELHAFHKEKYDLGLVSFCMTGISMVYEKLQEDDIPSLMMHPTTEAINNGILQLLMQINAIESTESQIVVLSMEMDLPSEYNLIHDNEYQLMLEKTRVSEQVYKFAEKIQAAVIVLGAHQYMLFSTRQILETATEQLQVISILHDVNVNTSYTLSIGIGYGKTAREAKYSAALGLNRALNKGGNQAYVAKNGKFSEPIYPETSVDPTVNSISDPLFKVISEATGISINNVFRIHCIKEKMKKNRFTSGELADEFGNTRRSMNRIIEKLEKGGYAEVEGTRMIADTGRPTRIIRLKF